MFQLKNKNIFCIKIIVSEKPKLCIYIIKKDKKYIENYLLNVILGQNVACLEKTS